MNHNTYTNVGSFLLESKVLPDKPYQKQEVSGKIEVCVCVCVCVERGGEGWGRDRQLSKE